MQVRKDAAVVSAGLPTQEQMEKIALQAKTPPEKDSIYVFAVRVCDDRDDRDGERFSKEAVAALAPMLVGKTAIADHAWSAERQIGRIFDTQVVDEPGCRWLKAWIYILRSGKNEELIREIEAGIKREVSIGCAVARRKCSVCGAEEGGCEHIRGEHYGGEVCVSILEEPTDAYEVSFVAVPAQKEAGVVKSASERDRLQRLEKEAAYGRIYRKKLCDEVVRLGLLLDFGVEKSVLCDAVGRLETEQLTVLEKALSEKAAALFPPKTQLRDPMHDVCEDDSAFLI